MAPRVGALSDWAPASDPLSPIRSPFIAFSAACSAFRSIMFFDRWRPVPNGYSPTSAAACCLHGSPSRMYFRSIVTPLCRVCFSITRS